jgi:hypothetical protein
VRVSEKTQIRHVLVLTKTGVGHRFGSSCGQIQSVGEKTQIRHVLGLTKTGVGALALVGLVLGLATDVGLFGWTLAALLAFYLAAAGIARRGRPEVRR